jgi:hypothetical protein
MPDRVDPAMQRMELGSLQSPPDHTWTKTQIQELKPSNHPMLLLRQARHTSRQDTRVAFASRVALNAPRARHRADGEGTRRTDGALRVNSV